MIDHNRFPALGTAILLIAGFTYLGTIAPAVATEDNGVSLASQIRELRAKVAGLEAALQRNQQGRATQAVETKTMGIDSKMGMMKGQGKKMMGMKDKMKPTVSDGQKSAGERPRMGMMGKKTKGMKGGMGKGMSKMGRMKGADQESSDVVLPAFPGTPEIYHIGSTEFFLDLTEKINPTADQRELFEKVKTKNFADAMKLQAKIDEAEQELWSLTGADKPDGAKIETKIREIAKLEADRRLAFIRAVGEAAKVLTEEQRTTLTGMADRKTVPSRKTPY